MKMKGKCAQKWNYLLKWWVEGGTIGWLAGKFHILEYKWWIGNYQTAFGGCTLGCWRKVQWFGLDF